MHEHWPIILPASEIQTTCALVSLAPSCERKIGKTVSTGDHLVNSGNSGGWEIVATNNFAGVVFAVLCLYLGYRHFLITLAFMDLLSEWLPGSKWIIRTFRKYNWFPNEERRLEVFKQWVVALALFFGLGALAGSVGWLKFIPK